MKKSAFSKFVSVTAAVISVFFLTGCAEDSAKNDDAASSVSDGSGGGKQKQGKENWI